MTYRKDLRFLSFSYPPFFEDTLASLLIHGGFGVESLSLTLPIFHVSFLLTPGFFPLKTKKYLHRHPADFSLE
jgi:hypothetical protein